MKTLSNFPEVLSQDEFNQLFKEYKLGNIEAKKKIIEHNCRLVVHIVYNYFYHINYDKEELIAVGMLALTECITRFDITRNIKFSTYATHCIIIEIRRFLKNTFKNTYINIEDGTYIDDDGVERPIDANLKDENVDILSDYEQKEQLLIIKNLINQLPKREKIAVLMYYGFIDHRMYTLKEIGEKLNVSHQRVHQILKTALLRLKKEMIKYDTGKIDNNKIIIKTSKK